MIVWWILIIAAIVALVTWITRINSAGESPSALDILKKRYAGGEISKEEFEEKKKDILG